MPGARRRESRSQVRRNHSAKARPNARHFYDSGEFSGEYDLLIEEIEDVYKVSWIAGGKIQATGVGMEVESALAA